MGGCGREYGSGDWEGAGEVEKSRGPGVGRGCWEGKWGVYRSVLTGAPRVILRGILGGNAWRKYMGGLKPLRCPQTPLAVPRMGAFGSAMAALDEALWQLGHTTWASLEGCLGAEPLRLLAESLLTALWLTASAISSGLAVLSSTVGDLLDACGLHGEHGAIVALSPGAVQRVLLWGLLALVGVHFLPWLLGLVVALLRPVLHWLRLCAFLGAFLHVVAAEGSGLMVRAAMLLGLWGLYVPGAHLEAAVRSLEWKVEELRRRQQHYGAARGRAEE
uniref:Transmembrane protein 109 n=1 Tax=Meleagris gallopavo TaxID=9103 RepID=G1MVX9_MELGA